MKEWLDPIPITCALCGTEFMAVAAQGKLIPIHCWDCLGVKVSNVDEFRHHGWRKFKERGDEAISYVQ